MGFRRGPTLGKRLPSISNGEEWYWCLASAIRLWGQRKSTTALLNGCRREASIDKDHQFEKALERRRGL